MNTDFVRPITARAAGRQLGQGCTNMTFVHGGTHIHRTHIHRTHTRGSLCMAARTFRKSTVGDEEGLRHVSCLVLAASIVSPNWLPSQCSTQGVDSHLHHLHACPRHHLQACARHHLQACPRVCACEQYYCKRNLFSCNSARQRKDTQAP